MNILVQPQKAQFELPQRFLLQGVNWQTYEKILEAIGNRPVRITYDRGNLELISPLLIHELYKCFFGRLFDILAEELDIAFRACGSTTFRRQDVDRGLEPDQCFYFGSIARIHDWATLNLEIDPPPDLAVEVDNTHTVALIA
jgi:Uma2 family endonuclease